jgi:hypothetical protein
MSVPIYQVPGCEVAIDPVCLLFFVSLPVYKLHLAQSESCRIAEHPLWQWCPRSGCGRAVKLSGTGTFLFSGLTGLLIENYLF